MRVALLTREYPPEVYGGAGVHVEYLGRELERLVDLTVHAWGADPGREDVRAYQPWDALAGATPHMAALQAMSVDLVMAAGAEGADVAHTRTWYANFAGHVAKLVHDIPHVATVHSLARMGVAGRRRAVESFAWPAIAEQTAVVYARLAAPAL